jgi:hypothetical protein
MEDGARVPGGRRPRGMNTKQRTKLGQRRLAIFANGVIFGGFSVDELATAKDFYGKTLGIEVLQDNAMGIRKLHLAPGASVVVYLKGPARSPATHTVPNSVFGDIEETVDRLRSNGIRFEKYNYTRN